MKIGEFKKKWLPKLKETRELDLLLEFVLGKSAEEIVLSDNLSLKKEEIVSLERMLSELLAGKPLDYILGERYFYGERFKIDESTLIPRPETEILVELASKKILRQCRNLLIVDIGTGSGNIVISLAKVLKKQGISFYENKIKFLATDISSSALTVARKNASLLGVPEVEFLKGDLLRPLEAILAKTSTNIFLLANLPYLSEVVYHNTAPKVKNYEPRSALLSGRDGLDHYRRLLKQLEAGEQSGWLRKRNIHCFWEISPEQKDNLTGEIAKTFPKTKIVAHKDLAKRWRIIEWTREAKI